MKGACTSNWPRPERRPGERSTKSARPSRSAQPSPARIFYERRGGIPYDPREVPPVGLQGKGTPPARIVAGSNRSLQAVKGGGWKRLSQAGASTPAGVCRRQLSYRFMASSRRVLSPRRDQPRGYTLWYGGARQSTIVALFSTLVSLATAVRIRRRVRHVRIPARDRGGEGYQDGGLTAAASHGAGGGAKSMGGPF